MQADAEVQIQKLKEERTRAFVMVFVSAIQVLLNLRDHGWLLWLAMSSAIVVAVFFAAQILRVQAKLKNLRFESMA